MINWGRVGTRFAGGETIGVGVGVGLTVGSGKTTLPVVLPGARPATTRITDNKIMTFFNICNLAHLSTITIDAASDPDSRDARFMVVELGLTRM